MSTEKSINAADLLTLIHAGDLDGLLRLLASPVHPGMDYFLARENEPLLAAVRLNRTDFVDALMPHFTTVVHEYAASLAYELDNERLAQHIHAQAPRPLHALQGLDWSCGRGWGKAAEAWLNRGAMAQCATGFGLTPLVTAASHGHLALTQRLLPLFTADEDRNTALQLAAREKHTAVVEWLWPHTPREGQEQAVAQASYGQNPVLLERLLTRLPPVDQPSDEMFSALCYAIDHRMPLPLIQRLTAYCDPNAELAKPLRRAVEFNHTEAIDWLIPRSDLDLARKGWTRENTIRWDCVYQLFPFLTEAQQQAWGKKDKGRPAYAAAIARKRAEQAGEVDAPERPRRRRRC
jgi:hypothetical protein